MDEAGQVWHSAQFVGGEGEVCEVLKAAKEPSGNGRQEVALQRDALKGIKERDAVLMHGMPTAGERGRTEVGVARSPAGTSSASWAVSAIFRWLKSSIFVTAT